MSGKAGDAGPEPDDSIGAGDGGGLLNREGVGTSVDKGGGGGGLVVGSTEDCQNVESIRRDFGSSFENVNTLLQSYLTIVSAKEGDLFREIITEGEIIICSLFSLTLKNLFAYTLQVLNSSTCFKPPTVNSRRFFLTGLLRHVLETSFRTVSLLKT